MNELISIIIPVYNVEKFLNKCIESVVKQTYERLEIILIDDGSTDNSSIICDEWSKKDDRIKVIHKENGGLSSARNVGLDLATGDYIGFVDSDDFIECDMFEVLVKNLLESSADISCCGRFIVDEKNNILSENYTSDYKKIYSNHEIVSQLLIGQYFDEAVWDKVYKKDFFNNVRFPEGEINEDIVLMIKNLYDRHKLIHIGTAKYYYRNNSQGITKSLYNGKMRVVLKHLFEIKEFILSCNTSLLNDYYLLQLRYSFSILISLYKTKKGKKKFKDDYVQFRRIFNEAYKYSFKSRHMNWKTKINLFLMRYHLWKLKMCITKS